MLPLTPRHMISTSLVYSGLTNAQSPFRNIFLHKRVRIVAAQTANSACRLSSSEVTVRRGCLSSSCSKAPDAFARGILLPLRRDTSRASLQRAAGSGSW